MNSYDMMDGDNRMIRSAVLSVMTLILVGLFMASLACVRFLDAASRKNQADDRVAVACERMAAALESRSQRVARRRLPRPSLLQVADKRRARQAKAMTDGEFQAILAGVQSAASCDSGVCK